MKKHFTEVEKLGIKIVDFGGHSEYHACLSLFIDSDGVFVICVDSNVFTEENAEDKYHSLVGTYIELISGTSSRSNNLPKVQKVATKVTEPVKSFLSKQRCTLLPCRPNPP